MVGTIGFTFLPSWATLFAVVQPAVFPSPAAPLCWVFCLCPRELVGPAGLCVQVLGRHCRCGPWQAIRPLFSHSSSFVLGMRARDFVLGMWAAGGSSGFVLGRAIQPPWARVSRAGRAALGLNHVAPGSEVLGLWVEQLASAPDALPPEVSGVGAPLGFHVWAPSLLICVSATGPQVSTGTPGLLIPCLQSRGRYGEGRQGPQLLPRVL